MESWEGNRRCQECERHEIEGLGFCFWHAPDDLVDEARAAAFRQQMNRAANMTVAEAVRMRIAVATRLPSCESPPLLSLRCVLGQLPASLVAHGTTA